eukprot:COSAG01_NODE_1210_length_11227_cov_46.803019_6_plen_85_part_00
MHGRRTALRYSPSTPSPAGARSRGQSTVLPFGSGWSAPSPDGCIVCKSISRNGVYYISHAARHCAREGTITAAGRALSLEAIQD